MPTAVPAAEKVPPQTSGNCCRGLQPKTNTQRKIGHFMMLATYSATEAFLDETVFSSYWSNWIFHKHDKVN